MMKAFVMCLTVLFFMSACNQSNDVKLTGTKPPAAKVQIENQVYETKLGSYCWSSKNVSTCVDSIGPIELLEGKPPISVAPGEVIRFVMEYEPQPNKFHINQIQDHDITEIKSDDLQFNAPTQAGTFYYSIG